MVRGPLAPRTLDRWFVRINLRNYSVIESPIHLQDIEISQISCAEHDLESKLIRLLKTALLAIGLFLGSFGPALAADQTFNLAWSGAAYGNGASATGYFTLDTALLNNPGFSSFSGASLPSQLSITVTGSSGGNGTFTRSDFSAFFINTAGGTLDFNSEWVGQSTPGGLWGATAFPTVVGDFNMFSTGLSANTPTGTSIFTLVTGGGQSMLLTSVTPVPEPESYVMLLAGLGLIGGIARRRRAMQA